MFSAKLQLNSLFTWILTAFLIKIVLVTQISMLVLNGGEKKKKKEKSLDSWAQQRNCFEREK